MTLLRILLIFAPLMFSCIRPGLCSDAIIAVINNEAVTSKELKDFMGFMHMQLSEKYSGKELEEKVNSMSEELLDKLIEDRLLIQEAKRQEITIDQSRINDKLSAMRKQYSSVEDFYSDIKSQGLTESDIITRIREQMLMFAIIDKEVRAKIIVHPEEVTDFYYKNIDKFEIPEQRDAQYLILKDAQAAKEMFKAIDEGKDMDALAKDNGLEVNRITVTSREELKKEIADAIFGIKEQEVSGPLEIEGKYYIFKLNKISLYRQQGLSEVQSEIYNLLYERKLEEGLTGFLEKLRRNAYIKIIKN